MTGGLVAGTLERAGLELLPPKKPPPLLLDLEELPPPN
jgi:hypothetical protein